IRNEYLGDVLLPAKLRDAIRDSAPEQLVVIPDGPLHKLPLEALSVSAGGGVRFVLDDLPPIAYAPSPSILALVNQRKRPELREPTLLTVGDPAYPESGSSMAAQVATRAGTTTRFSPRLPRLPFTAVESERVASSFPSKQVVRLLGNEATEANVVAALPGKNYAHIAAHGFADDRFGNLFAALLLAPPPPGDVRPENDGYLTLNEIYRLQLQTELTVLSACVTNVGPQRPLEAGVTLAGGFLCAGSRGVMASCWSVDDKATAELMGEFFQQRPPRDGAPVPTAVALKAARMKIRNSPGWSSPFYWAPFVYLGPVR
ncbi:MAG: CHAT domain-containing protein, partial [Gemmataceae bacterium]